MGNKWSDIEIELLRNVYPITDDINILNYFSDRTLTSIKVKAKRLKIYRNSNIKKHNRSNATTGIRNGMYGKTSKIKGITYDEYYGVDKSKVIKSKLSKNSIGKIGLIGEKNGMFRKTPYNKGVSPNDYIKKRIKQGVINYWNNLNKFDLKKRKDKLRKEWIIKRDKYSEIDTIPEKITESLLVKFNLKYRKKINIGYYNCDFIVDKTIIEVQGDYWHGNPKFYKIFDRIQEKNIKRDKKKLEFLQLKGFKVLFLWENDLKSNVNYCEELLINELL